MREALGLPHGQSYEAALICADKSRMHRVLAEKGVGTIQFSLLQSLDEVGDALSSFSFPVIVKPANETGSKLVAHYDNREQVAHAIQTIAVGLTSAVTLFSSSALSVILGRNSGLGTQWGSLVRPPVLAWL